MSLIPNHSSAEVVWNNFRFGLDWMRPELRTNGRSVYGGFGVCTKINKTATIRK